MQLHVSLPIVGEKVRREGRYTGWSEPVHGRELHPLKSIPTTVGKDRARLFLIDTGGFMNMISVTTAREVTKVYRDSQTMVKGLSGTVDKIYSADHIELQCGQVQYYIANEATLDLVPLSNQIGTEISGVLGTIAFLQLDVRIDYRDGLVDLAEKPGH